MSGYDAGIEIGDTILFRRKKKVVKEFYFTSDGGCHNSDIIRIFFEDGTDNGNTGLSCITTLKKESEEDE